MAKVSRANDEVEKSEKPHYDMHDMVTKWMRSHAFPDFHQQQSQEYCPIFRT